MVDGVMLLVDASEGPLPQTRYVLSKALESKLSPILVINKIDRPDARVQEVLNEVYDLFIDLDAHEDQLDFPVLYTNAKTGTATVDLKNPGENLQPLFDAILRTIPEPTGDANGPLQILVANLDYSDYLGRLAIARVANGTLKTGEEVGIAKLDGSLQKIKITKLFSFSGLKRVDIEQTELGDIVAVAGVTGITIGETITNAENPAPLPPIVIDEPTIAMQFTINTSPLAGREGQYVTSRNLRERLTKELLTNVALRVEDTTDTDVFVVFGRGELHLTILLENMRREGYEMAVSRPRVVVRQIDGVQCEPFEQLSVDVEDAHQGAVMESLGVRRGDLVHMESDSRGRTRREYRIPARGLIGFQGEFMNLTRGTGLSSHVFDGFSPLSGDIPERRNGVLISAEGGEAVAYALWKLQERGRMFVSPGDKLYEGMVIGIHRRDNDLVVNTIKGKQLTNVRASGKDEAIALTPPIQLTLEYAVEFIADDELVEITPKSIRIRKRHLIAHERKRASREAA